MLKKIKQKIKNICCKIWEKIKSIFTPRKQ